MGLLFRRGQVIRQTKSRLEYASEVITALGPHVPILGVCLGHQGIAQVYGGKVINAKRVVHGKTSSIEYFGDSLFNELVNPFVATRYHSLVVDRKSIPPCLEVTATSLDDGEIMGLRHRKFPIHGVQFHPESVLTKDGLKILLNFINLLKK